MGLVVRCAAILLCALVALQAAGRATGRPEPRPEDVAELDDEEAVAAQFADTEDLFVDTAVSSESVRQRRQAKPAPSDTDPGLVDENTAAELMEEDFVLEENPEPLVPIKEEGQKECRGRGRPGGAGNGTDTTGEAEDLGNLRNKGQRKGQRRNKGGSGNATTTGTGAGSATGRLVL